MLLWLLRGIFLLLMLAVVIGLVTGFTPEPSSGQIGPGDLPPDPAIQHRPWYAGTKAIIALVLLSLGVAVFFVAIDVAIPRKGLTAIGGVFFGLVVGMVAAYGLSLIIDLLTYVYAGDVNAEDEVSPHLIKFVQALKVVLGLICCFLSVSFVLQTKDDIRFVIPYVEFSRQARGPKPWILDTSVIIDGRVTDICNTPILDAPIVVCQFILDELQAIADSDDRLRRNRGRRGLDMLNTLQSNDKIEVQLHHPRFQDSEDQLPVDRKLIAVCKQMEGKLVTTDFNLLKVAQLQGVDVININELANAVKSVALPGETMSVRVIKPGEEATQGVGYLDDGTMIVVEDGRNHLGEVVEVTITSTLQTAAGRLLFGRIGSLEDSPNQRRRPRGRN
jgi:uncharacterized protein YacL